MPSHPPPTSSSAGAVATTPLRPTPDAHAPPMPMPIPAPAAHKRWSSRTLFGLEREIEIEHAGQLYRLRQTSLGKLILTK